MTRFIVRRILWMVPVLWAAATLVWVFMFLIPGDPARILAGQSADPDVLGRVRAEWGLDLPAPVRYGRFLWKLAHLDLGTSYVQQGRPVSAIIASGFMRTFFLALTATILAGLGGILFGLVSVRRRGTVLDGAIRILSTGGIAVPTFWLGLMLMLVFASRLQWLPVSGYGDGPSILNLRLPGLAHLVLPSLTLAVFSAAYIARVTRASLIEETTQEYVQAARARGLSSGAAMLRHSLANAMLPVVTLLGLNFGGLLGGAIATETVFNWPGVGLALLTALKNRDLPVVEGGAITLTAVFLLVNLAVDLSYAILDPRTRH
ncbi:MAG: ABC transporter permease [Acidobacteriota bacterium]